MELSGAKIFIESLKAEGVDTIFGYPGGAVLPLYHELEQATESINHVLVRHEQAAIHAAEGYAKSTNKVGVAIVTSGPGATNAVTGIADAHLDSVPLVVFTGQVPRAMIGNDAFQEVDIIGITRPCVKHNFLVTKVKDLAPTIKKAFYLASTGRPGPVLIDIPKDLGSGVDTCAFEYPETVDIRSYDPIYHSDAEKINAAVELLRSAKKPILYSGGGVILSGASTELTELARLLHYPVTNTLMGLGAYPATDPLFVGMLGMHGTYEANMAMHHADLVVAVGARFDDRVTGDLKKFCPYAKIIHIDIDPTSISKNVKTDVAIVGDVKRVLIDILAEIKKGEQGNDHSALSEWWKTINEWRGLDCLKYTQDDKIISPQYVLDMFWQLTKDNAYVTSDVGQHQMWAAQYYKFDRPNRWINSGGLGTMGFGLPAAMGVQMAHPDATVGCITGDGSIQMCIQELATCSQYRLPLNIISLNNGYLGMVRQWQEFFHQKQYSMSYMESLPDFVKLAEAYGHVGLQIKDPADVEGALKTAIEDKSRLYFLDFITNPEQNVYPMIPAGAGQNEMILE